MLNHLRQFLLAEGFGRPSTRLLVAVSGGGDSLALLHMLYTFHAAGGPVPIVAHLDHGLRGAESAAEAAFVAATAAEWGLRAVIETANLPLGTTPAVARAARYAFLARTAIVEQVDAVLVAHQADDQAETVLMHLLRGAGPAGLRGMRPRVEWPEWAAPAIATRAVPRHGPPLLRPLLAVSRAALAAYCADHGLIPRQDPTNHNLRYIRSRIRHQILPQLATENPHINAALVRTARICAEDYDFIQQALAAQWPKLIAAQRRGLIAFDRAALRALHPALRRYALRRAIAELGAEEPSFAQIDAALHLVAGQAGSHMQLTPQIALVCDQETVTLRLPNAEPPAAPQIDAPVPLPDHGMVPLANGWHCVVQDHPPVHPDRWWLGLAQSFTGPLTLRPRRPGDRMRPAGAPGSRRLQDIFVDLHVPRALRDGWPLLVAADGQILWMAGLRVAAGVATSDPNQATMWIGIVAPATE
ncbi:tRNA lysidine(34) synthetase TilS [Chloroflexus sp.]|uniref:tRNA lysidine(34) synthetase TilS n=1 Tax=Chloroflexus sp. TaxID=1904827 RepID=UPI00298ED9A6|nr:tRNA lysidine(34) synthetase TilS [Chloroflexus sp.]MCS6889127.1 tRNA lysidine(34) synthetase TilS [Chloroflexus sp.]MDW8402529.1 tRNA lysidine(34) synthetase TilS [Chloroflexus sp.]